jgi:EpsI family protein
MKQNKVPTRFIVAMALLIAAAGFLHAHKHGEVTPQFEKFSNFPINLAEWQGRDVPMDPRVLEVLGPGEFLSRIYVTNQQPWMDFFIAYFPSQSTGDAVHSPKNCLPGAGWAPTESGFREIELKGMGKITVNRYVIARGNQRNLVYYWYQSHGRSIASEYSAKIWLVLDSIKMNRTDAALVRIITPVNPGEDLAAADKRALDFAQLVGPNIDHYIPK